MSIASEYNKLSEKSRFFCQNSGEVIARVEPECEGDVSYSTFVFRWMNSDPRLEPKEALELAAWINKTFG